jgi:hypothetical protein
VTHPAAIRLKSLKLVVHFPQLIARQHLARRSETMALPSPACESESAAAAAPRAVPRFTDIAPVYTPAPTEPIPTPDPPRRYGWFAWREFDAATGNPTLHVTGRFRPPKGYGKCRFLLMEDVGSARPQWSGDSSSPVLMLERFIVPAPVTSAKPPTVPLRTAIRWRDDGASAAADGARDDSSTPEPTVESTVEISFEKQEASAVDVPLRLSPYAIGQATQSASSALHRYVTILPEGVTVKIKNV